MNTLLLPLVMSSGVDVLSRATAPSEFERDRAAILAMAGSYAVQFDFRETTSFVTGYQPLPGKVSNAHELVLVAEDRGTVIRLQHLLIADNPGGKQSILKHWRQDWVFEPSDVLIYRGVGQWQLEPVSASDRKGKWSQTVWQVDDTPRYGGTGSWRYDNGVTRWQSDETLRPLARRDAVRHPPYDRYVGTNRHALTPAGWVHEQDNAKVGVRDGKPVTFAHEVVLNTYQRDSSFSMTAAREYWARTSGYWAAVRTTLDDRIRRAGGIAVEEDASNGSVIATELMDLADAVAGTTMTLDVASARAAAIIDGAASTRGAGSRR